MCIILIYGYFGVLHIKKSLRCRGRGKVTSEYSKSNLILVTMALLLSFNNLRKFQSIL